MFSTHDICHEAPFSPDFQLTSKLGEGAFGTVFKAVHLPTGNKCAVKKIANAFANEH